MRLALSLVMLLAAAGSALGVVEPLSFVPPFKAVDFEGSRMIEDFTTGGSTEVMENYIRMTPDRASRRGWMWSRKELGRDDFSLTMRFRVSGQGKKLFGDGFALWLTTDAYHRDGNLHGFQDRFTGLGVIFDTFVNQEVGHVHKDISVLWNDGSQAKSAPHGGSNDVDAPGCDSNFRFHNKRDDFEAAKAMSAVRISYRDGKLTVQVDPKGTGDWSACISSAVPPSTMPADWLRRAHVGITATTGQLADNHDILSLVVSEFTEDLAALEEPMSPSVPDQKSTGQAIVDEAIQSAVEVALAKMRAEMDQMKHEMEHKLHEVDDSLRASYKKLNEREEADEARIAELEARLTESVGKSLGDKIGEGMNAIRNQIKDHVGEKLSGQIETIGDQIKDRVSSQSGGWLWPFVGLVVLVVGAFGVMMFMQRRSGSGGGVSSGIGSFSTPRKSHVL